MNVDGSTRVQCEAIGSRKRRQIIRELTARYGARNSWRLGASEPSQRPIAIEVGWFDSQPRSESGTNGLCWHLRPAGTASALPAGCGLEESKPMSRSVFGRRCSRDTGSSLTRSNSIGGSLLVTTSSRPIPRVLNSPLGLVGDAFHALFVHRCLFHSDHYGKTESVPM